MPAEVSGLTAKRGKSEILNELIQSAQKTNVLGLFIQGHEEMVTTSVTEITGEGDNTLIHFQACDLHGYPLDQNPVRLTEIVSVIHFNTLFNDPVYVRIRERRSGKSNTIAA